MQNICKNKVCAFIKSIETLPSIIKNQNQLRSFLSFNNLTFNDIAFWRINPIDEKSKNKQMYFFFFIFSLMD
jgi:hypothetical protein